MTRAAGDNKAADGEDQRVRVTYLCPVGEIGGAEKSMLDLMSRTNGDGFSMTAILLNGGPLEEKLRTLDIRYEVCRLPRAIRTLSRAHRASARQCLALPFVFIYFVLKLRKAILRYRPAVVVSNGIKCHVLSPFAAFATGSRLIWHVRDVLGPGFLRWWLGATARLFCDLVITNSSAVAETISTAKTVTIYNGIDLGVFRPDLRPLDKQKDLHLPREAYVIGTIGHLAPIKGLETLIDAASGILAGLPEAHFVIAGGAIYEAHREYERRLRRIVRSRGLEDRVHFLGFFEDVPRLLATFDIFVLCSHCEGFGRVVAEALAVGCPVVATAVGGVREIVRDGAEGLLVPPSDPTALAEGVLRLTSDPHLRKRLAERGGSRVREHFGLPRQTSAFRSAVLSVLSRTANGSPAEAPMAASLPGG